MQERKDINIFKTRWCDSIKKRVSAKAIPSYTSFKKLSLVENSYDEELYCNI